ncbi:2Fe-2S iron-sulfur cluster-binding protein [Bacteroidota bacterium]
MIRLIIDNREVNVPEGTTVLKAAESIGIHIPNMCYMDGFSNSPSCMLCLVKNINDEVLLPSCAMRVTENMEIITNDEEISEARKEALELLLSDHVGDCEAPCRRSCPAFMNIPLMNRLIASGHISESIKVVKEEIALPLILGYICSAPCEKACRRKQIDSPVSICLLKKYVAASGINNTDIYLPPKQSNTKKKIAVIGTGPAGLASAFYLLKWGHNCVLFDKNEIAGGSLLNVQDDELPKSILENEIKMIEKYGGEFNLNKTITKDILEKIKRDFDALP